MLRHIPSMEGEAAGFYSDDEEEAGDDDDDDEDPFAGHEAAYGDVASVAGEPQENNQSVLIEDDDSRDVDISDNDPIHNYHPSDTEDSEDSSSDSEDESYTEQELAHYRSIEAIKNAQKIGLEFSSGGWLKGNSALAIYVRHRIFELRGPFEFQSRELEVHQNSPHIPTFEDLPVILSGARFSSTGVALPMSRPLGHYPPTGHPNHSQARLSQHIAVRVSRDGNWVAVPEFRRLVRTVLRYIPKEFEKPGHIRISNQIRHSGFQTLLTKLYPQTYWLPLPQARFVTDRLLFQPSGRPFQLTPQTMAELRRLSTSIRDAERAMDATRVAVVEEIEESEVQHHPLSMGYASGSQILDLASECRSMVGAILSEFPQNKPSRSHEEQMHEVDDFLGLPRRATLELQPWKPITMCMTNNESTRLNIGDVNKFLIFANKQAMLAIDIYEPSLLKHDLHFKGLTMAHIFRCILRIKVIAELAECLDNEGLRINRDGPMWSLLLPFYVNGGTPNAAEMSVIAGQAPQFGRPRPNWDQPMHGLHNILHASRLARFPMDLVHREQFWEWVEHRGR